MVSTIVRFILMLWMDALILYGPVIYAAIVYQYAGFMYGVYVGKIATEESGGDPAVYNEYVQEGFEVLGEIAEEIESTTTGRILKKTRMRLRMAKALRKIVKSVL